MHKFSRIDLAVSSELIDQSLDKLCQTGNCHEYIECDTSGLRTGWIWSPV